MLRINIAVRWHSLHVLCCLRVVMSSCWTIACNSNCCIFVLLRVDCTIVAVKLWNCFCITLCVQCAGHWCPACCSVYAKNCFQRCASIRQKVYYKEAKSCSEEDWTRWVSFTADLTCINRPLRLHFHLCWSTIWLTWLGRCWMGLPRTLKLCSDSVLTSWTDPNRHKKISVLSVLRNELCTVCKSAFILQ